MGPTVPSHIFQPQQSEESPFLLRLGLLRIVAGPGPASGLFKRMSHLEYWVRAAPASFCMFYVYGCDHMKSHEAQSTHGLQVLHVSFHAHMTIIKVGRKIVHTLLSARSVFQPYCFASRAQPPLPGAEVDRAEQAGLCLSLAVRSSL